MRGVTNTSKYTKIIKSKICIKTINLNLNEITYLLKTIINVVNYDVIIQKYYSWGLKTFKYINYIIMNIITRNDIFNLFYDTIRLNSESIFTSCLYLQNDVIQFYVIL